VPAILGRMSAPHPRTRPLLLGEVALVAFLLFGYDRVAATANVDPETAYRHGRQLLAVEQFFHLAVEQPLNHVVAGWHRLGQALSIYYDFAHGVVTFTLLGLVYVFASEGYRRARTSLFVLNGVGLVVFWLVPVAPPRLLPGGGFSDVVAHSGTWGAWEVGASGVAEHANHFASLPSLHVAYAIWVLRTVLAASDSRLWRTLATAHVGVTVAIVVVTGNHYLIDVVAGAAVAEGAWWVAALPSLPSVLALRRLAPLPGTTRR
jgi:PAP2 superfamily